MTTGVPIRPDTLQWAIGWATVEIEVLAKTINVKPEKVKSWLHGTEIPTYNQAKKLADRCHVALSQLLLPPPKPVELPLKDFRRGANRGIKPSQELVEAVYDALRKRDWWREYRRNETLPFLQNLPAQQLEAEHIKENILKVIRVRDLQRTATNWGNFRALLIESIEQAGILVLCQGYAGTNTRRSYEPEEFSGFAIADRVAPVIFVNGKDYIVRQIFTLVHELVHVWLGQSILDTDLESPEQPAEEIERFCDRVAAELLMPEQDFISAWNGDPYEQAQRAASFFKVSAWAALKRAKELELITNEEYVKALSKAQKYDKPSSDGGNFWATFSLRNSKRFVSAVVEAAISGEISAKEMASLLNLSLPAALSYMEKVSYVSP